MKRTSAVSNSHADTEVVAHAANIPEDRYRAKRIKLPRFVWEYLQQAAADSQSDKARIEYICECGDDETQVLPEPGNSRGGERLAIPAIPDSEGSIKQLAARKIQLSQLAIEVAQMRSLMREMTVALTVAPETTKRPIDDTSTKSGTLPRWTP